MSACDFKVQGKPKEGTSLMDENEIEGLWRLEMSFP